MSSICKDPSLNVENVQVDLHEQLFARMNLKTFFQQSGRSQELALEGRARMLFTRSIHQQSGRSQELALEGRARMLFTGSDHLPSTTSSLGTRAGSWFMHSPTEVEETKLAFGPGDVSCVPKFAPARYSQLIHFSHAIHGSSSAC